jgi:hypothetical protein
MPSGFVAAAGYIGGDTPHVWTRKDWGLFNGWRKLPIFTQSSPTNTEAAGSSDAWTAVQALWDVAEGEAAVRGTPIALDLETAVAPVYVAAFGSVCNWLGFPVWPYGSLSYLVQNPPCDGRWAADWVGYEDLVAGTVATQYESGDAFDRSELSQAGYETLKIW